MSSPRSAQPGPYRVLTAQTLYTPEEIPGPASVVFAGHRIHAIWRDTDARTARQRARDTRFGPSTEFIDLGPLRLAPGYIDLHDHGFHGHDITAGTREDIATMAAELPRSGTTAFFPTIATTGRDETAQHVRFCVEVTERGQPGASAEILGIRMEGPFISTVKKGAQYAPAIRPPDPDEMRELARIGRGKIRLVDFAPEEDVDGRLLATLVELGILPCIGHTNATYEQAIRAIDGGARHCTHLFNAMSPLEHRAAGVPGAMLTDHRATVEMVADGIHLSPALLKLVVAARGVDNVALITDAVGVAGLPDGEYEFIKRKVIVSNGAVRLEDGTIAGSTLTMERAVRNMVTLAGCSWPDAIRMATLTPARIARVDDRKGQIVPGADADVVAIDHHGVVQRVWTRGSDAYQRAQEG
ncbi:MAG: N-acetylglucosamine-6-phosphate deacetylase [Nitrososphaerota archaeon]